MRGFYQSFLLALLASTTVYAKGSKPPPPVMPAPINDPPVVDINPTFLRERVTNENLDVLLAAHHVQGSKLLVDQARRELLPQINLNSLVATGVSANFILSSIQVLLPFLLPTHWFELKAAKLQLEADRVAFHLVRLNTFASAYSLYVQIQSDRALAEVFKKDAADWAEIESLTEARHRWGQVTDADFLTVQSQRALADHRAEELQSLLIREEAALRVGLLIPADRELRFDDPTPVPPSEWEKRDVMDVVGEAQFRAPELLQLQYLYDSAEQEKWARAFAFIGGASAQSSGLPGHNASTAFKDFNSSLQFHFGLDVVDGFRLADHDQKTIALRGQEVKEELERAASVSLRELPSLVRQLDDATRAEDKARESFQKTWAGYRWGLVERFEDVLRSRVGIEAATTKRLKAQADVQTSRIELHRLLLTDSFAVIPGCGKIVGSGSSEFRDQHTPLVCQN